MVDVRIGCSPGISAEIPAGTPWLMAMKTPPKYRPWVMKPATRLCPVSALLGQRARTASTMKPRIATTHIMRTARNVRGSI